MLIRIVHHLEEGFHRAAAGADDPHHLQSGGRPLCFSTGFGWALELTTYLFAWLVLFGISYGIKVGAHIGIDVWCASSRTSCAASSV
jgi:C4-dicarboxylate transporter DctQ subunit